MAKMQTATGTEELDELLPGLRAQTLTEISDPDSEVISNRNGHPGPEKAPGHPGEEEEPEPGHPGEEEERPNGHPGGSDKFWVEARTSEQVGLEQDADGPFLTLVEA